MNNGLIFQRKMNLDSRDQGYAKIDVKNRIGRIPFVFTKGYLSMQKNGL